MPVIVNVAGESIEDYVEVARRLDGVPGVAGIELNISCPNVGKGGLQFAIDAEAAGAVTAAVRRASDLPLLVKLSPNVADVRPIARAIEKAGADAISAINTLSGMAVRPDRTRPLLGNIYGGLSGPAIKPVALRIVYEVAQVVDIPIVAIGGVSELSDVLDFLAVGAVAVQVGTALFADPTLPVRLDRRARGGVPPTGARLVPPLDRDGPAEEAGDRLGEGRGVPPVTSLAVPERFSAAPLDCGPTMTTIRSAIDEAARAVIARRTEELFRRSGALREGHFLLKSGRHSGAYLEKFQVLQDTAATSELCWLLGHQASRPGRAGHRRPRRRPDDRRHHPGLRDRPPARDPGDLRRGGPRRRRGRPARVPARVHRSPAASGSCSSTTS